MESKKNCCMMIDPPSGWRYGFPKEIPYEVYEKGFKEVKDWLVLQGYPKDEIEKFRDKDGDYPHFYYRIWEQEIKEIRFAAGSVPKSESSTREFPAPFKEMPFKEPLKSLEQHNAERMQYMPDWGNKPSKNGIACPHCGEELFDSNPMMVLTSFPAKKNIHCERCKYSGYRLA